MRFLQLIAMVFPAFAMDAAVEISFNRDIRYHADE
jgi:hypothetical protein